MRYAVIGTGWIVQSYIDGTRYVPEWELAAVCSRSEERGRELAEKNGAKLVFTSVEELAKSDIECVYIASPNALHYEQSKLMLLSGKHVICEKPITQTPEQLIELQTLAKEKDLIYIEAIMYMYCPVREKLRAALKEIGEVRSAHFDFSQLSSKYPEYKNGGLPNIFNPKMATGCMMDLGIYCVYPAVDLFGEPQNILAASSFLKSGADAATAAIFQCGDVLVSITGSKTGQDYAGSQIIGDNGTIKLESISKLTNVELVLNSGERRIICGDTPKAELMGNEARGFYEFITEPEKYAARYEQVSIAALSVSKAMQTVRDKAGIIFEQ